MKNLKCWLTGGEPIRLWRKHSLHVLKTVIMVVLVGQCPLNVPQNRLSSGQGLHHRLVLQVLFYWLLDNWCHFLDRVGFRADKKKETRNKKQETWNKKRKRKKKQETRNNVKKKLSFIRTKWTQQNRWCFINLTTVWFIVPWLPPAVLHCTHLCGFLSFWRQGPD